MKHCIKYGILLLLLPVAAAGQFFTNDTLVIGAATVHSPETLHVGPDAYVALNGTLQAASLITQSGNYIRMQDQGILRLRLPAGLAVPVDIGRSSNNRISITHQSAGSVVTSFALSPHVLGNPSGNTAQLASGVTDLTWRITPSATLIQPAISLHWDGSNELQFNRNYSAVAYATGNVWKTGLFSPAALTGGTPAFGQLLSTDSLKALPTYLTVTDSTSAISNCPDNLAAITASGPVTFCPGGTVTLSAGSGNTYLWSNGSVAPSIVVSQNGSFRVVVTNGFGCSDTSATVTVVEKPVPGIRIKNYSTLKFCAGGSVVLSLDSTISTDGFSYQWNKDGAAISGATQKSYVAEAAGSYTLTVSGGNCSRTSAAKIVELMPVAPANITAAGPTSFCVKGTVVLNAGITAGATYKWLRDGLSAGSAASITATKAGNYTVITKLGTCYDTSAPVPVTFHPLPLAGISTSDPLTFCSGSGALLEASPSGAGYSYKWILGTDTIGANTPTLTAAAKGSYKVLITDPNGCSKISPVIQTTTLTSPLATITALSSTTLTGTKTVKLRANGSATTYTWQWYRNGDPIPGAVAKDFIASQGSEYTVLVTLGSCSTLSAGMMVTKTAAKETPGAFSGPVETVDDFELLAFPNPAGDHLTIQTKGSNSSEGFVDLTDVNGRILFRGSLTNSQTKVDMTAMARGIYLLRYRDGTRTGAVKIEKL